MQTKWIVTVVAAGSLAAICAAPAQALRPLPTYTAVALDSPEPQAGAFFGEHMDVVGDLDGDGVADVAISSTGQNTALLTKVGRVWIFSGRTRQLLRTIQNPDPQAGTGFGDSIIDIGDVNGDAVDDLAIAAAVQGFYTGVGTPCGAPEPNGCNEAQGRVYIFSGRTQSVLRIIEDPVPQPFAFFGFGFAIAVHDLDGDGVGDFVETAEGETVGICDDDGDPVTPPVPCPAVGAAYAFSGKTGALIHRFDDPDPPAAFGSFGGGGVTAPGDVTGDGVDDITVGAPFAGPAGTAFLFNGKTGALVRSLGDGLPLGLGGGFGFGTGSGREPGDVNGDGVPDIIVSAPGTDVGAVDNAGMLYLLSGVDGSIIRTLTDPNPLGSGSFSFTHADAGDLNGDGTDDILSGRFVFPDPTLPGGAYYVFDPRTGDVLETLPGMTKEGPGSAVASPGDVNGDGYPDYFLGGARMDTGDPTLEQGRVIVELSQAPPAAAAATPPAPVAPGAPGAASAGDSTAPVISRFALAPSAFRASSAARAKGTKVSFTLSEAATVRFSVEQARSGRRVGGRCVTATASNRRAPGCTLYRSRAGAFSRKGTKGTNGFTFRGVVGGHRLAPGRYRLKATARDAAGNASKVKRAPFRILGPA